MKDVFLQHGFAEEQVEIMWYPTALPPLRDDCDTNGETNIVFLGKINRYKGVDYLLRALSKIRSPFSSYILGDGPCLAKCQRLSRKLGLSGVVRFVGWVPHQEIKRYLQRASVVVVPSIWPEPFGIVGIEAMAYAKPVVAFDVGGIPDWLLDGETGYLVPPKDVTGLAKKIEYLLENPAQARALGAAGRRLVIKRFNKTAHFDRLLSVFQEAAEVPRSLLKP
jgi:glycosyltransferase involved in cell wall biosynthesis